MSKKNKNNDNIVCGWEGRGIFVRFAYFIYYLIEAEKTSVITRWPALRTSIPRQKIINPNKAFTNLLASTLADVRDCLILLDLILTLSMFFVALLFGRFS